MGATEQLVQPPAFGETNSARELLPSLHIPGYAGENGDSDETSGQILGSETQGSGVIDRPVSGPHQTAWIVQEVTDDTPSDLRLPFREEHNRIDQAAPAAGGSSVARKVPAVRKSPPATNRQQRAPAALQYSELSEEVLASNDRLAQAMANQDVATLAPANGDAGSIIPLIVDAAQRDPNAFALEHTDLMERYAEYLGPARAAEASIFQAAVNQAMTAAQNAEIDDGSGGDGGADASPTEQSGMNGSPRSALGGQTNLGDILDTDGMLSWMRQRPGEDHAEWLDRIERARPELSESLGRDLFEERLESFTALSSETGMTVSRADREISVTLSGADRRPLFSADPMGMGRLAEVMADTPSVAHIVAGIHDGSIELDKVEERLDELEALPTGIDGRRAQPPAGQILNTDLRNERSRLRIAWIALQARANGANPEEVGDILIASFAPDPQADIDAAISFLVDFLPGSGEIGSGMDSMEQYDAMRAALEAGDLEGAAENGLFMFLAAAGAIPGFGPFIRGARRLLSRALRSVPGVETQYSRLRLAQFHRQRDQGTPNFSKDEVSRLVSEQNIENALGILRMIMRDVTENAVRSYMKNAGFEVFHGKGFSGVRSLDNKFLGRFLDATTPQGFGNFQNLYLYPNSKAPNGAGGEVKSGNSLYNGSQQSKDEVVRTTGGSVIGNKERDGFNIDDILVFRPYLHQVDEEELLDIARKYLDAGVSGGRITQLEADQLYDYVMNLPGRSASDNPITLGSLLELLRRTFPTR